MIIQTLTLFMLSAVLKFMFSLLNQPFVSRYYSKKKMKMKKSNNLMFLFA